MIAPREVVVMDWSKQGHLDNGILKQITHVEVGYYKFQRLVGQLSQTLVFSAGARSSPEVESS